MLEIARKSGLGQSSLYYWYRRKEQIVAELLQQVNRLPLAFARQLESEGDGADVQLFRLVRFDVLTVCEFPLEITEVHRFSRRDKPAFETYWRERRELTAAIESLVARGIGSSSFRKVDARLCALTIIAQDESVQNWYLREPRPRREPGAPSYRADEVADFVAMQTLGGLLASPSGLSLLQRKVARNGG